MPLVGTGYACIEYNISLFTVGVLRGFYGINYHDTSDFFADMILN
jgi:hypothetical protein